MRDDREIQEWSESFVSMAKSLVGRSRIAQPPIDPAQLAKLQGVQRIILSSSLSGSGRLVRIGPELAIVLNKSESRERRNFTCCHEIAHTFALQGSAEKLRASGSIECDQSSVEEDLCDRAAAEMLMPECLFRRHAETLEPSIDSVLSLSKSFGASIRATMVRLGALSCWRAVFSVWRFAATLGSAKRLRVAWSVRPAPLRCFVPRHASVDPTSSIYATFVTGHRSLRQEAFSLGSLRGSHLVESARFGDHVVSIVHRPT